MDMFGYLVIAAVCASGLFVFWFAVRYLPSRTVITLRQTSCLGSCPVFSLTIDGNGNVTYVGKQFVKVKGEQKFAISKNEVEELLQAFYALNYFSLKDEYTEDVRDLPSSITSLKHRGRYKQVINCVGGPIELSALEETLARIAKSRSLIP